jgi:hypothetical protein
MDLQPPAQVFSTTLYDRHQPKQLSFVFIPARSLTNGFVPELGAVKDIVDPNANFFHSIAPSYLPAALASLLAEPAAPNPFSWVMPLPLTPGQIWVEPNSVGFAEYVAFSESLPIEESPLRSKSLMAVTVATGAKIGLIAGGATPFVLLTVPAGIILCMAGVVFGPALGEKASKLIGA